ncbi:uncharacterized protein LOC144146352 [Haemaphysalis longicornis]
MSDGENLRQVAFRILLSVSEVCAQEASIFRPMGKHPLFCTFGNFKEDFDKIDVDGVCDYVFVPFYVRGERDTFAEDSHPVTRKMLAKAAGAQRTSYAINVPHKQVAHLRCPHVLEDLRSREGQRKMREYWTTKRLFHYGVLDLEVRPGSNNMTAAVSQVFDVLKAFRRSQRKLQRRRTSSSKPQRGFVVLGFRMWPRNMMALLWEIGKRLKTFMVDGLIPLTHISDDEFTAGFPKCLITGPAPFEVTQRRSGFPLVGMRKTMAEISVLTEWNRFPSLAVSVTMCTRLYMAPSQGHLYAPCMDHRQPPSATSVFCNDPSHVYAHPVLDAEQLTMVSRPPGAKLLLATFESFLTIRRKICLIMNEHRDMDIGLAMFDIDCEDWDGECVSGSDSANASAGKPREPAGHIRFDRTAKYFRTLTAAAHNETKPCI